MKENEIILGRKIHKYFTSRFNRIIKMDMKPFFLLFLMLIGVSNMLNAQTILYQKRQKHGQHLHTLRDDGSIGNGSKAEVVWLVR